MKEKTALSIDYVYIMVTFFKINIVISGNVLKFIIHIFVLFWTYFPLNIILDLFVSVSFLIPIN